MPRQRHHNQAATATSCHNGPGPVLMLAVLSDSETLFYRPGPSSMETLFYSEGKLWWTTA